METVSEVSFGEFRGNFPDVPIAAGVDIDALKADDPDPLFVTLPIIPQIGATSRNGLLYDEQLAESIVTQINTRRPEGIFGHIKEEDRATAYPEPAAIWIGAKKEGDTVWAKAFITDAKAKTRIKRLKAAGGEIATSIYGKGAYEATATKGVRRLSRFDLESLDFAPSSRAALGNGSTPHVTAEIEQEQEPMMADKQQVIAELTVADIPALLREQIVSEASKQSKEAETIAELTSTVTAKDAVIAELTQTVEEMRRERVDSAIDAQVAELTDWQVADEEGKNKLAKLRALLKGQIVTRLGSDFAAERVAEIAAAAWDDLKPIAEMVRDALAGPAAVVNGKVQPTVRKPLEDTPENRQAALNRMGIQV